jgi:hypothetical protein
MGRDGEGDGLIISALEAVPQLATQESLFGLTVLNMKGGLKEG